MNRFDRAILWLADRMPMSLALGGPMGFAWGFVCSLLLPRVVPRNGTGHWIGYALMLVSGFLFGMAGGRWQTRWMHRLGIDRCTDCFRIGRWAIRVVCRADDSLAIPEPPPSWQGGCWCQRHAMVHLLKLIGPYHNEVSLVPYDRNWGRLVNEERERRGA